MDIKLTIALQLMGRMTPIKIVEIKECRAITRLEFYSDDFERHISDLADLKFLYMTCGKSEIIIFIEDKKGE